tara:strand:- start:49 stop:528 length:480 start_codon:yes stop_codon:yes gene_type:complete
MLYLKIKELVRDTEENWFTRNDLYVVIKYNKQYRRTSTLWNIHEPKWNEIFLFEYEGQGNIQFEIYDDNNWRKEELMSSFSIPVEYNKINQISKNNLLIEMGNYNYETNKTIFNIKQKNDEYKKNVELLTEQTELQDILLKNYKKTVKDVKYLVDNHEF